MSLPLLHAGRTNPGISAALDLKFASTLSLTSSSGITPSFSRASSGTYFGSDGLLKYAGLNLINYSEDFTVSSAGNWTDNTNTTITANQGVSPDGTITADLVRPSATGYNALGTAGKSIAYPGTGTTSIYAKASGKNWIRLWDANGYYPTWFNLATGTVGTVGSGFTASIQNVGNGWYRCVVSRTLVGSVGYVYFGVSDADNSGSATASGTDGVLVWGAQLETGTTATNYAKTTNAANSAPRFDFAYNGTSWVSRGLLVEEQRTNSVLQSQDFGTTWQLFNTTRSTNVITSPDGTQNADSMTGSAGSAIKGVYQQGLSFSSATATFSVFAKKGTQDKLQICYGGTDSTNYANFDLTNGVVGSFTGSASIVDVGNGWYRCIHSVTGLIATDLYLLMVDSLSSGRAPTATTTGTVYLWQAQGELGAFATSAIPTTSSSTTRSADVCQITGTDFSGFWNASEGSFAVEYDRIFTPSSSAKWIMQIDDGTNSERIGFVYEPSAAPVGDQMFVIDGGSLQARVGSGSFVSATPGKFASCYKLNDFAATLNGSAVNTDTSGTLPTVNKIDIGRSQPDSNYLNGHIARLRYYRKRLPNATLQLLSEPDPTLNLQFALNKSLTPVAGPTPSFSRASTGTYFNSSGVLTSAAINAPRFDHVYDGTSWVSKGLLIEEQRTNLVQYSEQFNTSPWAILNASISANAASSPDGSTTAEKLVESATGPHGHEVYVTFTALTATYTFSIFAKAAERSSIYLSLGSSITSGVYFNLSNGTIGTASGGLTGSIQNVGNGWYRCSVVGSLSSGTNYIQIATSNGTSYDYTGNGTSGLLLFGAQLELGAFSTSYIPTTTASVVRSADVCQITGTSFNWMWNQGEGSVVAEWDARRNSGGQFTVYWARDAASSNTVLHTGREALSPPGVRFTVVSGASVSAEIINAGFPDPGVQTKTAGCYKVNDFAYAYNGNLVGTDTLGAVPVNPTDILIGSDPYSNYLNGHIAKLIYYPARLTNTKLQQLST